MKKFKPLLLLLLFIIASCSKNDDDNSQQNFDNFTTEICPDVNGNPNVTGIPALYWDYANARPVPLTQIPTIANPGQQFIHSGYPQLGFTMPVGYSAQEISSANPPIVGVNVTRTGSNRVLWQYVPLVSLQGQVPIGDIIGSQLQSLRNFHNYNGDFNVLCTRTESMNQSGLQFTFASRLVQFGEFTAVLWVNTLNSNGFTQISVSISSAPTAEFNAEVFDLFLPLSFQLLVIDDGVRDSDLDGFPDNIDAFPFDPNRH